MIRLNMNGEENVIVDLSKLGATLRKQKSNVQLSNSQWVWSIRWKAGKEKKKENIAEKIKWYDRNNLHIAISTI